MNQPLLISLTIITGGLAYMLYRSTLPRGVRNNNPLNIRDSANDWEGKSGFNRDKEFEEFKHPVYGFRAGARILRSYSRQGYKTLSQMIYRFAPDNENDTALYVQQISQWTGLEPNQTVNVNDNDQLARLLYAMSRKEVGNYYGLSMAQQGVAMA
nr:virion protein [Vibrio gazogenes]